MKKNKIEIFTNISGYDKSHLLINSENLELMEVIKENVKDICKGIMMISEDQIIIKKNDHTTRMVWIKEIRDRINKIRKSI